MKNPKFKYLKVYFTWVGVEPSGSVTNLISSGWSNPISPLATLSVTSKLTAVRTPSLGLLGGSKVG